MSYATIDDLRSQLGSHRSAESQLAYAQKMLHAIPDYPVVDREKTILEHCTGKRVLEFGASGPLSDGIRAVATQYFGVDRVDAERVTGFDLDDVTSSTLPSFGPVSPDVIICGELLEHLSNPGWFLTRLRRQYLGVQTIFSVPNAFSEAGRQRLIRDRQENVNIDHCAWYSIRTLRTLLERHGYTDLQFAWYRGQPLTAEGIVVTAV